MHGYLPSQMISTVLIPIIKNKSDDVTDQGIYMPVARGSRCFVLLLHFPSVVHQNKGVIAVELSYLGKYVHLFLIYTSNNQYNAVVNVINSF